jgi:protein-S-isoprenylcysteine O-methyltransferase Ste14
MVMTACYVISARNEERLMADGKRGAEYVEWQRKTWRMIPFIY